MRIPANLVTRQWGSHGVTSICLPMCSIGFFRSGSTCCVMGGCCFLLDLRFGGMLNGGSARWGGRDSGVSINHGHEYALRLYSMSMSTTEPCTQ